jgi:apolipoprotein N-acyltransferase
MRTETPHNQDVSLPGATGARRVTFAESLLLPLFSAALCAVAIPNEIFLEGLWPMGFLCLIPFFLALLGAPTYGRAAFSGAVFGAAAHALTSYWLFFYKGFAFWTLGTTTIVYGIVFTLVGLLGSFLLRSAPAAYRPAVFALGWTAFEYLKSVGFLGYPWGLVPYSLTAAPLFLQAADVTGVYGLSFVLSYASATIAGAFPLPVARRDRITGAGANRRLADAVKRNAAFAAFLVAVAIGYGGFALSTAIPQKASIRATLVQQNTDPWIAGEQAALESNIRLASEALERNAATGGAPVDLIVFSETSLQRPFDEYRQWFAKHPVSEPLLAFLKRTDAQLLTGAPVILNWERWEAMNSVILLSGDGRILERYGKMHPVPFAEAIPLMEYEWFRTFMRDVVGLEGGWVMGDRATLFTIVPRSSGGVALRYGTPICFEDAFADLCRRYFLEGADLLINLTNDSWSRKESAQIQHWAIARLRAIENRRTLVRSTNAGVSCVVDAWGRVIYDMPQFEARAMTVDIPVYAPAKPTIYTVHGDWFAKSCVAILAAVFLAMLLRLHEKGACRPE